MAKRKYRRKKKKDLLDYLVFPRIPSFDLDPDIKRSIYILIMIIIGALGVLGIFNAAGIVGVYISLGLEMVFGWGKVIIPFMIIILGVILFNDERFDVRGSNYFGLILLIISSETLMQLFVNRDFWGTSIEDGIGGGYIGLFVAENSLNLMGIYASWITFVCLFIISLILTFNTSFSGLFGRDSFLAKLFYPFYFVVEKIVSYKENRELKKLEQEDDEEVEEEIELDEVEEVDDEEDIEEEELQSEEEVLDEESGDDLPEPQFNTKVVGAAPSLADRAVNDVLADTSWWQSTGVEIKIPVNALTGGKDKPKSGDIKTNTEIIHSTLANFNIPVDMGEVAVGPTVTQYTFKPTEGVKLAKITGLSNDLALALAAHPIRIEAPIPGKSLVGVEVPNETKAIVTLRELLKSKEYEERDNDLMVALGKDVSGKPWLYNVAKMPHLLVAGATNSGKSVCLNTIIVSLLYQNTPDNLRFIMVDPKRVELPIYDGIPYLLTPVITDVDKTVNALKWCLKEMDRRYETLQKKRKKNIQSYNEVVEDKMPYIVFIIDELADLMVIAAKEIETAIIRLAQMARAVGIHLILATQRPSVDVITGLIKANMPSRIAFSVASGTDSRTILDSLGAEKLLGRGDMLFATAEISKPVRIQGAYVSDSDIKKIIRLIKKKGGETKYVEDVTDDHKVRGIGGSGPDSANSEPNGGDARLEEAKEVVINDQKASASYLQRKLSVGYARAAKLLDLLEEIGVVGPANGSKPREILISREQYENMMSQGTSGVNLHSRDEAVAPDNYLGDEEGATILKPQEDEEEEEEEEDEDEEDLTEEENEDIDEERTESEEDDDDEEINNDSNDDGEEEDEDEDEEDEEESPDEKDKNVPFDKLFSR